MKFFKTRPIASLVISGMFVLFNAAVTPAAHHEKSETSAADVKKSMAETYRTIKDYSVEQRDEAVAAAKEKLEKLDARMDAFQKEIDEDWEAMSRKAKQESRASLSALRKMRNDAAEWYGGMRHSSAKAWKNVKDGFSDSFDRLEKAFAKAREDFTSKE